MDYPTQSLFATTLPDSMIKRLSIRAREIGAVNLGQGIPSFPTPPHIIAAAQRALQTDPEIGIYPNFLGLPELRDAIAARLNRDHQLSLQNDAILVSVGAMEGIATSILSIVENGDRVAVLTPDYANHFPQLTLARANVVEVPMIEQKGWRIDLDLLETEAKKGLKLLLFTNPGNPTGVVFSNDEMKQMVNLAKRYGFWIAADETYQFLTYGTKAHSLLDFWSEYERLVTVRSFSKQYAMTGWRVGYVVARPDMVKLFARTHDGLVGCVPRVSQMAAVAALGSDEFVAQSAAIITKRRQLTVAAFEKLSTHFTFTVPAGAYYLFPRYHLHLSAVTLAQKLLEEAKVVVVPGSVFGAAGEHHIRISFAGSDEVLIEGFSRLQKFFTS